MARSTRFMRSSALLLLALLVTWGFQPIMPVDVVRAEAHKDWWVETVSTKEGNVTVGRFPSIAIKPNVPGDQPFEGRPVVSHTSSTGDLLLAINGRPAANGCGQSNNWHCFAEDKTFGVNGRSSLAFEGSGSGKFGVVYSSRNEHNLLLRRYDSNGFYAEGKTLANGDADNLQRMPTLVYAGTQPLVAHHRVSALPNSNESVSDFHYSGPLVPCCAADNSVIESYRHVDLTSRKVGYYASPVRDYSEYLGAYTWIAYRGVGGELRETYSTDGGAFCPIEWPVATHSHDWFCKTIDAPADVYHISAYGTPQDGEEHIQHVAYYDHLSRALTLATWVGGDSTCGSGGTYGWSCAVIEVVTKPGQAPENGGVQLVMRDGVPHIAYIDQQDQTNSIVKLAYRTNSGGNCGPQNSWRCDVIDDGNDTDNLQHVDMAISDDNTIYLVYHNATAGSLQVATPRVAAPKWSKGYAPSLILYDNTSKLNYTITNPTDQLMTGLAFEDALLWQLFDGTNGPGVITNTCGGGVQVLAGNFGDRIKYSNGELAAGASCTVAISVIGKLPGTWKDEAGPLSAHEALPATQAVATLSVAKRSQTITFAPLADRPTNASPFTPQASATSGAPITFAVAGVCALVNGAVEVSGQAGTCTVTAKQAGNTYYNPAQDVQRTFAVNDPVKQNQTITFAPVSDKTTQEAPFTIDASASSGLPITISASGACSVSGLEVTLSGTVGTCTLTAAQAGDGQYNAAAEVVHTFAINDPLKQSQTITFPPLADLPVDSSPFTVIAGASSGLPVAFTAAGVCSIAEATVTLSGEVGTCTITANQAGNDQYLPAPAVAQTFNSLPSTPVYRVYLPLVMH